MINLSFLIFALTWNDILAIQIPPPNLGDIRLKNPKNENGIVSGILQVYITDGSSSPTWSSVCHDLFGQKYEGTTACQQLGYNICDEFNTVPKDSDPVWLTEVICKQKTYFHLLHCDYKLKESRSCSTIVELHCSDKKKFTSGYIGEVALCAPDNNDQNLNVQSVSTGVVIIYLNDKFGPLSFIRNGSNDKALAEEIDHYRGNLICQQQGFQQVVPGSVQILASYKNAGYQFTQCAETYKPRSWISNKDLTCESRNYNDDQCSSTLNDPCFSCCYTLPHSNSYVDVHPDNYVVLQCMYDVYSNKDVVPYGAQTECEFGDFEEEGQHILKYNKVCAAGLSHSKNGGYKAWTAISVLAIIILIITLITISIYCYKKKKNYDAI